MDCFWSFDYWWGEFIDWKVDVMGLFNMSS